jgi:hypothetical protein
MLENFIIEKFKPYWKTLKQGSVYLTGNVQVATCDLEYALIVFLQ